MSSRHFIIATGERPRYPDIEGAKEYGITRYVLNKTSVYQENKEF